MQGSKKPPTSEVVEASKSDWRNERNTAPPSGHPPRRDDRAEPDDDGSSSSRVDVVNVDGGGSRDNAATGMGSLRRELAKLHQQAAAVEKSLEDQRRDRSDSLDRLERATERVIFLETRLAGFDTETAALRKLNEEALADLQTLRAERDDLALAVEAAKVATSELGKLKEEVQRLRASEAEAARAGEELAKARDESSRAVAEARQAKADVTKARAALDVAEGDAAMVGEQASKIRDEASKIRIEAETARVEATKARDELTKAREEAAKIAEELAKAHGEGTKTAEEALAEATRISEELAKAREEASKTAEELATAREEIARSKEDNTRDRATARDRIDLIERALDDARAATSRTESELEAARTSEERLGRQLEAAQAAASQAESEASATAMAHAALDLSVRRLREEIAGAFARVGHGSGPPPLPAAAASPPVSIPPEMVESVPPSVRADGVVEDAIAIPAAPAAARTQSAPPRTPRMSSPAAEPDEDGWQASASVVPSSPSSSPASKSVPPPASAAVAPSDVQGSIGSIPPPTYASVPPQVHQSTPPAARQYTGPPPPAPRGSMPPGAVIESAPPPTRRPGHSMPPPPDDVVSKQRQELLAKLVDPNNAEEAAIELAQRPEWLCSVPPPTLIAALASVDYNTDGTIFELARAWEREPLCHSLIAALRSESEPRLREHTAWLLKHLAAPSSWKAIADIAKSDDETVQLRRWLLEGLDRMAAGRAIGWRELGEVVTVVSHHPDSLLRDGVVGILLSLDRSDEKRRLLLEILRTDDDEVVLASAVNALASVLPMELDPTVISRLLEHPSARVQRSVRDLIERAKQTKP